MDCRETTVASGSVAVLTSVTLAWFSHTGETTGSVEINQTLLFNSQLLSSMSIQREVQSVTEGDRVLLDGDVVSSGLVSEVDPLVVELDMGRGVRRPDREDILELYPR